jgi:hypothetical protein
MNVNNIEILDFDGIDSYDYPHFVDAFVCTAIWKDSHNELTEEELTELNSNHSDWVHEQLMENEL